MWICYGVKVSSILHRQRLLKKSQLHHDSVCVANTYSTDETTGVEEWKRNITYSDVVGICMAAAGVEYLQMKSELREIDGAYFFVLPYNIVVSHNR